MNNEIMSNSIRKEIILFIINQLKYITIDYWWFINNHWLNLDSL